MNFSWRSWRWVGLCLLAAGVAAIAWRPRAAGDGWEYLCMLESWFRHLSPDQRPDDIAHAREILAAHTPYMPNPHDGFFVTESGRWFSYHFWLYSLLGVPAKAILRLLRRDEFGALAWTNAVLFVSAIA